MRTIFSITTALFLAAGPALADDTESTPLVDDNCSEIRDADLRADCEIESIERGLETSREALRELRKAIYPLEAAQRRLEELVEKGR